MMPSNTPQDSPALMTEYALKTILNFIYTMAIKRLLKHIKLVAHLISI
jgi:hypothetical protein